MSAIAEPSPLAWREPVALRDQVAVVTGGSGGIGLAIARELDARGCRVVVAGRDPARVERAAAALGRGAGFAGCDVRDRARVEALFEHVLALHGRLDILVASAGIGRGSASGGSIPPIVAKLDEAEWDEVVDTNLRGAFLTCRAAARIMVRQRAGQILNISSARGARRGPPSGAGENA
jgi:3-oxoacyl-[acyl-carrier protein] reductase